MADDTVTTPSTHNEAPSNPLNAGANLFRVYLIDVDSDPDSPVSIGYFKRGSEYTDIQSRVRNILKGSAQDGDEIYRDRECTDPVNVEDLGDNWLLALVRKQRAGVKKAGVDREWLRMVMENPDISEAEKLALIQKHL